MLPLKARRDILMIARLWHGKTPLSKSDAYLELLERQAVPNYGSIEGCRDVFILRRETENVAHFMTLTFWESREAIEQFAGSDIDRAKYYPEDDEFLLEFEPTVSHYEVH